MCEFGWVGFLMSAQVISKGAYPFGGYPKGSPMSAPCSPCGCPQVWLEGSR